MNENPAISYIIPCYNLDIRLIERAVDSVRISNDRTVWEIVIVDDGSADTTVEDWVKMQNDSRMRYYRQNHAGSSVARNTGLGLATSDYVHFVDADDYLFIEPYRAVLDILCSQRPDIVMMRLKKIYGEVKKSITTAKVVTETFPDGVTFMRTRNLRGAPWGYIFKKSTVGDTRFPEGLLYEDEEFTARLFLSAGKVVDTNLKAYAYCQRKGSNINDTDPQKVRHRFSDLLEIIRRMKEWETSLSGKYREAAERRCNQVVLGTVYRLLREAPSDTLHNGIDRLREMGCYPLPKRRYTRAYSLFRVLTDRRWKIALMRILLKKRI